MKHTLLPHKFIAYNSNKYDYLIFKDNINANIFQITDFSKKVALNISSFGLKTGEITLNQEPTIGAGYFMAITDMNNKMLKYEEYTADKYANDIVDYFVKNKDGKVKVNVNFIRKVFGDGIKIFVSATSNAVLSLIDNDHNEQNLIETSPKNAGKIISGMDSQHVISFADKNGFDTYEIDLPYPSFSDFFYVTLTKDMLRPSTDYGESFATFKNMFSTDKKYVEYTDDEIIFDLPEIKDKFGDKANTFNIQIPNGLRDVIIHQCDEYEYQDNPRLILPPEIPTIKGSTTRIYYENAKYQFGHDFDIVVPGTPIAAGGMVYQPTTDWDMSIIKFDDSKKTTYTVRGKSVSKDVDPKIQNAKVMLLGESTTDAAEFRAQLQKLVNLDTKFDVKFIGTRGDGSVASPYHEGYPGWSTSRILFAQNYNNITNSFFNPAANIFDLDYYFSNNNVEIPDVVYIAFGINDISPAGNEDKILIIQNIRKMMDAFYDKNNNIRFVLGLTNLPSAWEQYENTSQYEATRGILRAIERMIFIFGHSNRVTLAPLYLALHRKWHMQYGQQPVVEFSDVKEYYGTNNVHPQYLGYDMTASMAYAAIRYSLSK